ncbi:MAG: ATP-binding protein [Planctomycetia bacterium]|nr:ATP-binding protein [Planctomycetia bacterium]
MLSDADLGLLMQDLESDRVERKASFSDSDRAREAVCAFANDLPNHNQAGVLFFGVSDDGRCTNLSITDDLLLRLSDMRSDGNILPFPTLVVQKRIVNGCETAVVMVAPADAPPVRFKGRVCIRVGPRRAYASAEEERRLSEKRRSRDLPFDLRAISAASLTDLDLDRFTREYLPVSVARDVLDANQRTIDQQLASLRFIAVEPPHHPTVTGILVVGKSPQDLLPGAYIQFLRIAGDQLADPIAARHEIFGPVLDLLRRIDEVMLANIDIATDIQGGPLEVQRPDYPLGALQQLVRNAVMHRDYQSSNAPIRVTWFNDRIEIQNPGGPFGQVTVENFGTPGITDYRNPHLAESLRNLGFVQRFGVGIAIARKQLADNGSPPLEFERQPNHVLATIRRRT